MTVHMLRYQCSGDAQAALIPYLETWPVNHTAWEAIKNEPPTLALLEDGTEYYQADWRFAWGDNSKEVLTANLVAYTRAYASWHAIGYHECEHDQDDRTGCQWDEWFVNGDVPDAIQP